MKNLLPISAFLLLLSLFACKKSENILVQELPNTIDEELAASLYLNTSLQDLQCRLPNYLVSMGLHQPAIDNAKANLGRVVFYDKNLSADGKISCASCHKQAFAFADNLPISHGVGNQLTFRNSLSLTNVANFGVHYSNIEGRQPALLWDGRASDIVEQAPLAFANPHEMGLSMSEVVEKAKNQPYYPYFMKTAFGDREITEARLLEGLQEFVRAMGYATSKLDKALDKVNGDMMATYTDYVPIYELRETIVSYYYGSPIMGLGNVQVGQDTVVRELMNFTQSELRGRNLFAQNCTKCHTPIRTLQEEFMACNGLEMKYKDRGLGKITGRPEDDGVFKSPSLRNIALTAPYMHDGRFKTLYEVMDFYSTGMEASPNLHPLLRDENGQPKRMNFTQQQKLDLVAFLHTMTSHEVQNDKRFSNPFYQ
jgi:cytochrome c peroxidase